MCDRNPRRTARKAHRLNGAGLRTSLAYVARPPPHPQDAGYLASRFTQELERTDVEAGGGRAPHACQPRGVPRQPEEAGPGDQQASSRSLLAPERVSRGEAPGSRRSVDRGGAAELYRYRQSGGLVYGGRYLVRQRI